MGLSKRVSVWTAEDVSDWIKVQYPSQSSSLRQAMLQHAISGRALLRLSEHQLTRLGVEPHFQREILQDVLLLKVQEELENLNDIFSAVTTANLQIEHVVEEIGFINGLR